MMQFLDRIRRAYRDMQLSYEYDIIADSELGWDDEDSGQLQAFFSSVVGRKLKVRLTNYVMRCALEATRHPENTSYHNGLARGVAKAVRAIEEHFVCQPRQVDKSDTQPASRAEAAIALN